MSWLSTLVDGLSGVLRLGTRVSADPPMAGGNSSGEPVTDGTVLALSAAWACVNLVAGTIATLPVMVYRPAKGGRVVASDHWLYRILHDDPNADQTAVDFWEYTCAALELRGNAYAEKIRGSGGQVVGLDPIAPGIVSCRRRGDGELEYRWTWNGVSRRETSANVLHIRGFGGDPLGGISPISAGAETFGHARALNRTSGSVFRNAMMPSGVYQTSAKLTAEQTQQIEQLLAKKYQGAANAGRPLVIGHDLKWEQLTMSPEDMEMLESRGFSVEEVCRMWGVPPHMIGHTAGNTQLGSSISEQTRGFVMFTLRRRLKRIEAALRKQLLTPQDIAQGIIIEINLDGLLRGAPAERSAFYNAGLQNGWFTINEVRALENLPPVEGGDVPRMQMQNMPITMTAAPSTINATAPAQ
ncbi:phage portal protein [Sphingobium sp. LSP13-1-1.1]|uniref:phage portal protein n=1 Tax=Sphingobium sp. LSP13-1-1.1 TaxID=3135234 RepID=UPI00342D5135